MSEPDGTPRLSDPAVREVIRKAEKMNVILSVTRVDEGLDALFTRLGPPPAPEPDDEPER